MGRKEYYIFHKCWECNTNKKETHRNLRRTLKHKLHRLTKYSLSDY